MVLSLPVIDDDELAQIIGINEDGDLPGFAPHVVSGLFRVAGGGEALAARLPRSARRCPRPSPTAPA